MARRLTTSSSRTGELVLVTSTHTVRQVVSFVASASPASSHARSGASIISAATSDGISQRHMSQLSCYQQHHHRHHQRQLMPMSNITALVSLSATFTHLASLPGCSLVVVLLLLLLMLLERLLFKLTRFAFCQALLFPRLIRSLLPSPAEPVSVCLSHSLSLHVRQ